MVSDTPPLTFLSVINSGLSAEAWPIEIAWGFQAGPIRSMLIKPAAGWSLKAWDKRCEGAHRIELETLLREGQAPLDAALVLNAALGQSRVYAVSPKTDSYWLFKLYKAGDVSPNFQLEATVTPLDPLPQRAELRVEALRDRFAEKVAG